MLEVTEAAVKEFKKLIAESKAEGSGVRIFEAGGGCCGPQYGLDISEKGEEGDVTFNKDGLDVYLDAAASAGLAGATLDYIAEGAQAGFVILGLPKKSCDHSCHE